MYITAQGCRLRYDLYCVEWDIKLCYTIPYHTLTTVMAFIVVDKHVRYRDIANVFPISDELQGDTET